MAQNGGGALDPCLGHISWSERITCTVSLLSHPLLRGSAKELLAGSGGSTHLHTRVQTSEVAFVVAVPATAQLLKLSLRMLCTLTAANPANGSGQQLKNTFNVVHSAQLFLYLCTEAALEQQGRGDPGASMGQQTLRRALDALPAVTTWLSGLLLALTKVLAPMCHWEIAF